MTIANAAVMCQRIAHAPDCTSVSGDPDDCAAGCAPAACRVDGDHPGADHLDPRSPHYDGPETAIEVLPLAVREHVRYVRRHLPDDVDPRVAVHAIVKELNAASRRVAAAWVDRDRGIRDAMARALDCDEHGKQIRALEEQVDHFDQAAERNDRARIALLGFLHGVDDLVRAPRADLTVPQVLAAHARAAKKAHAAHQRAWSK